VKLRSEWHAEAADLIRKDLAAIQIAGRVAAQRIGISNSTFNAFLNLQNRTAHPRTIAKLLGSELWSSETRHALEALRDYNDAVGEHGAQAGRDVSVTKHLNRSFEAISETPASRNLKRYRILKENTCISFDEWLILLSHDDGFVDFFISLFTACGFHSYSWETPPITASRIKRDFEFVIHNLPTPTRSPDLQTYSEYFDTKTAVEGIVAFENLGRDALLVVPSPYRPDADYSGLAQFFRDAPIAQQRALWRELAKHANNQLSDIPLWVSVAGGGINWLHIRLDSIPKYYRYAPYTNQDQ